MKNKDENLIDEILEVLWMLWEERNNTLDRLLSQTQVKIDRGLIDLMVEDDLIEIKNHKVEFTPLGKERAQGIIRRHRLAEVLFSEVFQLQEKDYESSACSFEHVLEPAVTESICSFLGHPPFCPHGKPITKGSCCDKFKKEMKPLVVPLIDVGTGQRTRIVFIAAKYHSRLEKLSVLGITPGQIVRVHQKAPSFVIQIDETEVAIDKEIAKEIYVKNV